MKNRAIAEVLSQQFGLHGDSVSLRPIGNGHINTTMLLKNKQRALVVQKLNTVVFPEPEQLVKNARKIEHHLESKAKNGDYELAIIRHVSTVSGDYLVHIEGEVWRALEFIGGSYSEDVVDSELKAAVAANAFGQFASALDDFDATQLHHVIPDFHNLAMRIEMFEDILSRDPQGRSALCQEEIAFCRAQFSLAQEVADVEAQLPLRACHNDTKINNMLFCSESNKARAVIDLDTCMPGYWFYDFGDMVRTFCSPEAEDSINLANVRVREEIFAALVKGYKGPLSASLTDTEKHSFILGAKVMPFMIGLRFLTDYLDGDNYFATKHSEHNLQRARNQFALYRDIVEKQVQLSHIIDAA
ncbi:aminoglycoside phosphotransferase family protein [Pseudoalteromonas sp. R3]|uniref:phosphotransferase enzyme family protein n=1 Tax=Pseudoalteromonas sp. R3 TaxID=1709477 RepID=UPI0006B509E2|nr:aminoglycoside phosphotransferase family protein [Pseudoalteromonas sp. R3]QAA00124.1 aminoglycoside phosphotransferase family protein [Pseudoalteromonas sp. R3]